VKEFLEMIAKAPVDNPDWVGAARASTNRNASPPRCFSDQLCCDANSLGVGCFRQLDVQNAIFQHRAHLRAVNLRRKVNDP
jgi:hypothetical protein